MLSRSSNQQPRPRARLRHSKSHSSNLVRSTLIEESLRINPEIARQHALIAASTAFGSSPRSNNQPSENTPPSKSLVTESMRFTGPDAKKASITRREAPSYAEMMRKGVSRQSPSTTGVSQFTALPPIEAPRTPPTSSFRTLKKARSMFSPLRALPEQFSQVETSRERPFSVQPAQPLDRSQFTAKMPPNGSERLPNSHGLLQGAVNPYHRTYEQDRAIKLANEEFRRQAEQQEMLKENESPFSNVRQFSRTLSRRGSRSGSRESHPNVAVSTGTPNTAASDSLFNPKTRKVSSSIKEKIKKIFRRSSDKNFPQQQVTAGRWHFGHPVTTLPDDEEPDYQDPIRYPIIPMPDQEMLQRVSSRPSSTDGSSARSIHETSRPGSANSNHTARSGTEKSRVTSWGDSTATASGAGTLNHRLNDIERKRLSVIQEHGGPHQPSSSYMGSLNRGFGVFRQPMRNNLGDGAVDPQDIYSALNRRIQNGVSAGSQGFQHHTYAGRHAHPPREPFQRTSTETEQATHTTVRIVSKSSDESLATSENGNGQFVSKFSDTTSESGDSPRTNRFRLGSRRPKNALGAVSSADESSGRTLAEADKIQSQNGRHVLREAKSTLFSRTRHGKQKSSSDDPSPYRKALQDRGFERSSSEKENLHPTGPENDSTNSLPVSESVYSRRTTGTPYTSRGQNSSSGYGSGKTETFLISRSTALAEQYTHLVGKPRFDSSQEHSQSQSQSSSGEWRGWINKQVKGLEEDGQPTRLDSGNFGTRKYGHVRESAQIYDSEDEGFLTPRPLNRARPSHLAVPYVQERSSSRNTSSSQTRECNPLRYPLISTRSPRPSYASDRSATPSATSHVMPHRNPGTSSQMRTMEEALKVRRSEPAMKRSAASGSSGGHAEQYEPGARDYGRATPHGTAPSNAFRPVRGRQSISSFRPSYQAT